MAKSATDKMLDEVLKDSPQHLTKLLELRKAVTESRADYLDAKEHANECKKAFEGARQKIENYLKDLTEANMFDKAEGKGKGKEAAVKTEQTELTPVWPFPLPADLREITLGDISCNEKVSGFSAMIAGSLRDKDLKTAGDVEKFCCGDGKFTDPTLAKQAMEKFLETIGKKQGSIVLNALATVKANWTTPKKGKAGKVDWPFPVDGAIAGHTLSQVNEKFPKTLTTAALTKLAESGYLKISDLNTLTDAKELSGIVGPGPAKKLVEAVGKYVAEGK